MAETAQHGSDVAAAPFRKVRLGKPDLDVEHRADGAIVIRPRAPLDDYPARLTDRLHDWAERTPDNILFAARDGNGAWRTISYAQALDTARRIGQALLARNLSAERPVVILSGNDLEHAMIGLACLYAGIAYAPVSPAYSLVSTDF
ncbi:MAG: feruloyl-CoA synthase, partial [Alphaproteobacteria bacterium]|nr:feruloyl-CoA synthase [Alphaproteobacteria bacterium]